jgi:hypothetical protein
MSSNISIPVDMKEFLRQKILGAYMEVIPKDRLDELIETEVRNFFETEQLLTVQETQIAVDNPSYDPKSYRSDRTLKRDCLTFGSKMTPFRQLVWSTLHQHLQPVLSAILADNQSKLNKDLGEWVTEIASPVVADTNKATFTYLATSMSSMMLRNAMQNAITTSHNNMQAALMHVGINSAAIDSIPPPIVPPIDPTI